MLLAIARTAFVAPRTSRASHPYRVCYLPAHYERPRWRLADCSSLACTRQAFPIVHAAWDRRSPSPRQLRRFPARAHVLHNAPALIARHRRLCTPWCSLRHHPCPQRAPYRPRRTHQIPAHPTHIPPSPSAAPTPRCSHLPLPHHRPHTHHGNSISALPRPRPQRRGASATMVRCAAAPARRLSRRLSLPLPRIGGSST
ncbi:hypothetical protein B0H14DRAFT_2719781 [Mycena olivaceomarginata]|nr:hypothetical protein B0H14DRAFT_2719781 [Mycena olivaceomarginata]